MKTPRFKTEEEAARFWDFHSTVDYLDEWEDMKLEGEPDEDVCRRCGSRMQKSSVDVDLFGKFVSPQSLWKRSGRWKAGSDATVWPVLFYRTWSRVQRPPGSAAA